MKKFIKATVCAALCVCMMCSSLSGFAEMATVQIDSITVMKNDDPVAGTNILYNDRTYVPLREIAESLGCVVGWEASTNTAAITGQATSEGVNLLPTDYEQEYNDLANAAEMNKAFASDETTKKLLDQKFNSDVAALNMKYKAIAAQKQSAPVQIDVEFNSINVIVNGTKIEEPNILYDGRTYVPFRAVFETLGCEVLWHEITQTATIKGRLVIEEIYTSFEEEYATLSAQYKEWINEQKTLAQQAYDGAINRSYAGTGGQVEGQVQLGLEAREEFDKRAEALLGEFVTKVNNLKIKYGFTGEVAMDPTLED